MGTWASSQYLGQTLGVITGAFLASVNGFIRPNFLLATAIGVVAILLCIFGFREPKKSQ